MPKPADDKIALLRACCRLASGRLTSSRRGFVQASGLTLGALLSSVLKAGALASRGRDDVDLMPLYLADHNGDGRIDLLDRKIVRKGIGGVRGYRIEPKPGYEHRADLFGRGLVDDTDLNAFDKLARSARTSMSLPPRPITIAWHYGWYHRLKRLSQTVRFVGGNYKSDDVEVETVFNRLKNEMGITVDALSWITPTVSPSNWRNFLRGYVRAPNVGTRYTALLYESTLSLPISKRVDFNSLEVRERLVADFALMGRSFNQIRNRSGARLFQLQKRPVIFIYGSHTWGTAQADVSEFDAMDRAIEDAIDAFTAEFGGAPYLIGEELLLASRDDFLEDRQRRSRNFDAAFIYHHAAWQGDVEAGGGALKRPYINIQRRLLRENWLVFAEVRNRFTGRRILVIPSLAAGFAKRNNPSLLVNRAWYADFLKELSRLHEEYIGMAFPGRIGTRLLPSPIYTVGSWNEEYEGHAVLPAAFNESVTRFEQGGFDLGMAIKQVFGWNHYEHRDIIGT